MLWKTTLFISIVNKYCHNSTNNPKQLKTTLVGVVLLLVGKTANTPHDIGPSGLRALSRN